MLSIDDCWSFLEDHIDDDSALPAGASPDAIRQAEAEMGMEFPEDLRRLLLRHDGSGDFFIYPYKLGGGVQTFLALEKIVRTWKEMVENCGDFEREDGQQAGPVKANCWNRH